MCFKENVNMSHRGYTKTRQVMEFKRKNAQARQAEYDKLTVEQKLAKLPPEPHAAKQRAKLVAQLKK